MSVVAMLQGTVETDLATLRTALSLAGRMNVPLRALCVPGSPGPVGTQASSLRFALAPD